MILVRFKVTGSARYLSHAETMRVFQRACVRSNVPLKYSQGFNPRPKISLPLPRSVSVACEDEMLCIGTDEQCCDVRSIFDSLNDTLPDGIDVTGVELRDIKTVQPSSAEYVFVLREIDAELEKKVHDLLQCETFVISRQGGKKAARSIDIRAFVEGVEIRKREVRFQVSISSRGSIRVNEMMEVLGIGVSDLAEPVTRSNVQWDVN